MVAWRRPGGRPAPPCPPARAGDRPLTPPRRLLATVLAALAAALLLTAGAGVAVAEPSSVEAKRAEVARIQAELDRVEQDVGAAVEAHNGAKHRLSEARARIAENRRTLRETEASLGTMRERLSKRLRAIYATPEPTLAEILFTSGSLTEAADQMELLDRLGQQDAALVDNLRESQARLKAVRAELVEDRAAAEDEVEEAARQKRRVEGLMAERRAVLAGVEGELRQMLAAERRRRAAAAEAEARAARERQAAESAAEAEAQEPSSAGSPSSGGSGASSPSPAPAAAPSGGGGNASAASIAMQQLGTPYVWGGASPGGFDCSGLISYAYAQVGKSVPHFTGAIWSAFPRVSGSDLQVGDVVFFRPDLGHAGLYIGGGQYVHAPQTGDVVKVSSMAGRSDYQGAVRP